MGRKRKQAEPLYGRLNDLPNVSYYDALPVFNVVDNIKLDRCEMPHLTLKECETAWYITGDGCLRPINDVGYIEDFVDMLHLAIKYLPPKDRMSCLQAKAGLDFTELLDRWYILNELAELRATFPLFRTRQEAMDVA